MKLMARGMMLLAALLMLTGVALGEGRYAAANVGDYVTFGAYEQDGDTSNGAEPIEWLILAREDDRMLVISRYALECMRYNNGQSDVVTWRTCTLRKWLNGEFITAAFQPEEQAKLIQTLVTADKNPGYDVSAGYDTEDKVFLLSVAEAQTYFTADIDRSCIATPYAVSRGAFATEEGYCWQWLRTPGSSLGRAAGVGQDGTLNIAGGGVRSQEIAVRPAMWVLVPPEATVFIEESDAVLPGATEEHSTVISGGEKQSDTTEALPSAP